MRHDIHSWHRNRGNELRIGGTRHTLRSCIINIRTDKNGSRYRTRVKCSNKNCKWSLCYHTSSDGLAFHITDYPNYDHSDDCKWNDGDSPEIKDALKTVATPKSAWPPGVEEIIKDMIRNEKTIQSDTPDQRIADQMTEIFRTWNIDVQVANYQIHYLRDRYNEEEPFDLRSFLTKLEDLKKENPDFVFAKDEDEANVKLRRVFFATAQQARNAKRFGDVMLMDATFGTNKYGWHLVFIVGVDANFNTCILGVALLSTADTESFEWALRQGKAMGLDPLTSLLDGDDCEHQATARVFPDSQIMLCIYHFGIINVPKNLMGAFGEHWSEARTAFWSAYYAPTPELFEHHFHKLRNLADFCLQYKTNSMVIRKANKLEGKVIESADGVTKFVVDSASSGSAMFTVSSMELRCTSKRTGDQVRDKALR